MSRGTIYMILDQYGRLGEPAIQSYTRQKIAHWNIRGANILLDSNGIVKLTNFGIHKQIAEKCRTSWLMDRQDSPYWMAPEVIMNPNVRNSAADIWSLGCTVLEMATLKQPLSQYDGVVASFKVAHHKELPTVPVHLSDACKDFLRQCLQWNPLHRATASQLLEHPFVKDLSPLGERILVSTSSGHPAVTNAVKSECYLYYKECIGSYLSSWESSSTSKITSTVH
ncbi:Protein kinase superfamily protein [Perilla frutescens var. frutescens]|nr:Protein kinase superfamily protein [Perilla frutescens var. frutescens]